MSQIHIAKLIEALEEIEWDYEFKITIHKKDGSATLEIPDFIMRDMNYAVESGYGTPRNQVMCRSSVLGHRYDDEY